MAKLLIGHPEVTWREWLKANRRPVNDLVVLDPAEPTLAPSGQLVLYRGDKPVARRFFGSLDPNRSPHLLIAAAAEFRTLAGPGALYQLPPYQPSPLAHQTVHLLARLLLQSDPEPEILVAEGTPIEQAGFPIGPKAVTLENAFPTLVSSAQRKAQWLAFFERAESQTLQLDRLVIEGGRLGAGRRLKPTELPAGAIYAELAGPSLFLVADGPLSDEAVSRALDHVGAARAHVVHPSDYAGLFVGLARESGEDFALGVLQSINFESMVATLLSDAVPPAPARLLRLGSLKITPNGPEAHEIKPWSL